MKFLSSQWQLMFSAMVVTSCGTYHQQAGFANRGQEKPNVLAFASVGERRMKLVEEEIPRLGCVVDERKIRMAKDGEAIVLNHETDRRGDCQIMFRHLRLPKGKWALYEWDGLREGGFCVENGPEKTPRAMEVVAAVISGRSVSEMPRSLAEDRPSLLVKIHREHVFGWDVQIAHWASRFESVWENSFYAPFPPPGPERELTKEQIPFINQRRKRSDGSEVIETLFWFEKETD